MLRRLMRTRLVATTASCSWARPFARTAVPQDARAVGGPASLYVSSQECSGTACGRSVSACPSRGSVAPLRRSSSVARAVVQQDPAPGPLQAKIAMVGAGNMGGAMLQGWIDAGILSPDTSAASARSSSQALRWKDQGIEVFGDVLNDAQAQQICEFSDILFLGVKPRYLGPVLAALAPHITPKHTLVSIAAGWTIAQLEAVLPPGTAVMRVMPNTPILVGQGASVYCLGSHAGDADRRVVHDLLQACGVALEVSEDQIDAVVGVSGSGPAYMFQVLEAMADGGVRAGLPRDQALLLAAQTMKGAAEMVLSGGGRGGDGDSQLMHPGVLKDQVTSPGGTTITAVSVLEEEGVRSAFIKAVSAATEKSRSMSAARDEETSSN